MNELIEIKKHRAIGNDAITSKNSLAIFGNTENQDLVFLKVFKQNLKSHFYRDEVKLQVESSVCDDLMGRVLELRKSNALLVFTLTQTQKNIISDSGKVIQATHLRLHIIEDKLRISVFNLEHFERDYRLKRKNSLKIRYLDLNVRVIKDFSFTIRFDSFLKLPTGSYNARVGDNSICTFEPHNEDGVTYLIRDQDFIEPVTQFHSPAASRDICFVFHPKSSLANQDTTQFQMAEE